MLPQTACNLCLNLIEKDYERYRVDGRGKFDIYAAIQTLPFDVPSTSSFVCRSCLNKLKKRQNILLQVREIEETFRKSKSLTTQSKRAHNGGDLPIPVTPKKSRLNEGLQELNVLTSTPASKESHSLNAPLLSPIPPRNAVSSAAYTNTNTEKRKTNVTVKISYPSKDHKRELPEALQSLGKMLVRGTFKQIASAVWRIPEINRELTDLFLKEVEKETSRLCAKKAGPNKEPNSCLMKTDKESMLAFSLENVSEELKEKAPIFHGVLSVASTNTRYKRKVEQNSFAGIAMAASICLRNRSRHMIATQLMLTIFLYHSNWMSTLARLSKLRLTTSHAFLYKKLDDFGQGHNKAITQAVSNEGKFMEVAVHKHATSDTETTPNICAALKEMASVPESAKELSESTATTNSSPSVAPIQMASISESSKESESTVITNSSPLRSELEVNGDGIAQDDGRKLTFDNIDYKKEVHYMTEENQNIDKHCVTYMSTENRVSSNHLSDQVPEFGLMEMENGKCIPDNGESMKQRSDYIALVGNIITTNIPCLNDLSEYATRHIPHCYSKEMREKTNTTFLGIIHESENDTDGILEIMRELHKYVPFTGDGEDRIYGDVGVVGDQLSVERAVNGHMSISNGFTPEECCEGLHFEIADWHSGNKFLEVAFSNLFHIASSKDKCTMYSDKNLINRRNVKTDVSAAANACRRFFKLEVEARIIAACLTILGLESIDDKKPSKNALKDDATEAEKRSYVKKISTMIVDTFVVDSERNAALQKSVEEMEQQREQDVPDVNGKFPCRFPGCTKVFAQNGKWKRDHEAGHDPPVTTSDVPTGLLLDPPPKKELKDELKDDMYAYQKALLDYGMLVLNFFDGISEGDGDRVYRCWKYFIMYLKQQGGSATKYSLEALYLLFQVNALLSPKSAHSLIWNRFIKNKSGPGGNIPLDLQLEFYNRSVKQALKNLGPNASKKSIDRIRHSLGFTTTLMENFDDNNNVFKRSGRHVRKSIKGDLAKIVKELMQNNALEFTPGRKYQYYSDMKTSILSGFNLNNMYTWINAHKKYMILNRRAR